MSNNTPTRHINVESDFRLVLTFTDGKIPTYPWKVELSTSNTEGFNTYAAGFDGQNYYKCLPLNESSVLVLVNRHRMRTGVLSYKLIQDIPDALFSDRKMDIVTPGCEQVELWYGPSDNYDLPVEIESAIVAFLKGDPGSSAYELYKEHHPDTELTEEEYAAYPVHAGDAALAAVEKVEQTEERIEAAEKVREEAEQGRILSEQERVEAESSRAAAEQGRVRAEQGRESAEILRVRAEQERVAAEASRVQGEESRIAAETAREEAEQTRIADEEDRVAAESARAAAEQKRQTDTGEAIGKAAAATKEAEDAAAEATDAAGSIVGPQDVLAHSACSHEERIAHLERLLADILSGEVYIPKLTVRELSVWGADNLIVTGRGAPSRKPDRAGQFYIDIGNDAVYHSVGNAAVSDWKIN